ncbi:hypothetical protein [Pseudoalteromonas xiamenensis]
MFVDVTRSRHAQSLWQNASVLGSDKATHVAVCRWQEVLASQFADIDFLRESFGWKSS